MSQKLDVLLSAYSEDSEFGNFNGAVLVADASGVIYKNAFGLADMDQAVPNELSTRFRIASLTKQFTALLVIQLYSENLIQLDASVSDYLPEYRGEQSGNITIHQLLTHSSGIPDFTGFYNYRDFQGEHHDPEQILGLFEDRPLEFKPGQHYRYSNSGYVLLGVILEKLTSKPYGQLLEERIFSVLQMKDSGYEEDPVKLKGMSKLYLKRWGNYKEAPYTDLSLPYAAGGIYSTVEDLYKWDRALYSDKLLSGKYRELLFKKYLPASDYHYGYGWFIGDMSIGRGEERVEINKHGGGMEGLSSLILRIPSIKASIILLDNTQSAALHSMSLAIVNMLFGYEYEMPKKSAARSLKEFIDEHGVQQAMEYYYEVKASDEYYFSEHDLIVVGYELLHSDRAEEAEVVFKECVSLYPESFNAYDCYAESLMVQGKDTAAIENYLKSVELKPWNQNGLKMLKKLGVNVDSLMWDVPKEQLELLSGDYIAENDSKNREEEWLVRIEVVDGQLALWDKGYQFNLIATSEKEFRNQDINALLEFEVYGKTDIRFLYNKSIVFKKQNLN